MKTLMSINPRNNLFMIFMKSILLLTLLTIWGCSGGSSGDGTSGANSTPPVTGQVKLSGAVQADPNDSSAVGHQKNATVYVVGQQENAVQTDSNGNYQINVKVNISGLVSASPGIKRAGTSATDTYGLVVMSADNGHGRKVNVQITEGQDNQASTIYINTVGSISGKVLLQNETNHTGILVYIPGTSFSALSDASGNFTISNVPAGTYDFLRAEKDGYHYSILSDIAVATNATSTVTDQVLMLSTGPMGQILIANNAAYSTRRTINLNITATDDAVLMMISENAFFSNTSWQPIQSATTYAFSSDGEKTLWVKFADANGLESPAFYSNKIFVDSNPLVTLSSPVPSAAISETTPVFSWSPNPAVPDGSYHVQLSLSSNFTTSIADAIVSSTTYTLPSATKLSNNGAYYCRVAIVDNGLEWNWAGPWSFTVDIGRVTLVGPVPYANTDTKPVFSWSNSAVAGPSYRIQIARDTAFADLFEDSAITSPSLGATNYTPLNSLANNKVYYWRVAVIDANGVQGNWSQAQTFTVNLGAVTLFTPSGITNDSKPKLAWADSPLAGSTYRVQLTNTSDSTFSSPIANTVVTSASYTPATALANGGYQWRVAVIDANGYTGSYSSPLSFSVDIGTVTLSSPSGAVAYSRPSFAWSASAIANATYRAQISHDSGFTNLQEDSITTAPSGLTSPSYAPVNTLQNATTYYWRVQVIDANGTTGAWSAVLGFSVDLGTVVLLTPADGSFIANTTSILDWSDSTIPGSKTYDVQLATDTTFSAKLVNQNGLASSQYTIGTNGEAALTNGQAFYWRTRVVDANGVAGQWATSGKPFTVNLGTVNIVGPSGAISDTKPTISWTASSLSGARYWLQVSNDNSNWTTSLIVNTILTSAISYAMPAALVNNTTYYVRVAVVDANNVPGDFAGPQAFTVNIGTITLQSPTDLASLTNTRPTLTWSASTLGPNAKYHVQVATDTGFTNIVEQSDTAVNSATYTLTAGLPNGQPYYWRVAVIDANDVIGAYCTFRSFSIDLGAVSLLTPAGSTNNTTPTLDWSDSALPGVSYRVQFSTDSGFGSTIINTTTAAGVSQYTLLLANKLTNGASYHWRVAVIDANSIQGSWSSTQSFAVDLGTVSLTSPVGSTIGQTTPSFFWSASGLPSVKYHIQVARDTAFTQIQDEATNIAVTNYTLPQSNKLSDLTPYYWRVSVIDQNGVEGASCSYATFAVNIGTVSLNSPASSSLTNSQAPTFSWGSNANAATYNLTLSTNSDLTGGTNYGVADTTKDLPLLSLPTTTSQVYFWAVTPVDANSVLGTKSDIWSFTLDTVAPTNGSVVINGGNVSTSNEMVTLAISASDPGGVGVDQMWVSTNSSFSDGAWESYATMKQFTFTDFAAQNTGTMTAYVKFKDIVGNPSGTYSDSINLARTIKSGTLSSSETWTTGGNPYVIKNTVVVTTGQTLTINPGAIVKFDAGAGLYVSGTLVARGTGTSQMITFTSNKYSPAPGDWASIYFVNSSADAVFDGGGNYAGGSILEWSNVEYAGSYGYGAIRSENSQPFVNNCDIRNNAASGIYAYYYMGDIKLTNNILRNNTTTAITAGYGYGGGLYAVTYSGASVILGNSIISGNSAAYGGGVYINDGATVTNTVVGSNVGTSMGGGIRIGSNNAKTLTLDKITVSGNRTSGHASSLLVDANGIYYVTNSTINDNTSTLSGPDSIYYSSSIGDDRVYFNFNNFMRNGAYEFYNDTGSTANAVNNYWGTTVDAEIRALIYDADNLFGKGIVSYVSYSLAPGTTNPISSPSGFAASAGSGSIAVNWMPDTESDRAGYRVYWGTISGYPYANSTTVSGADANTYTINSGLVSGTTYYVTVTAYDGGYGACDDPNTIVNDCQTNGNESWYALEKMVTPQ